MNILLIVSMVIALGYLCLSVGVTRGIPVSLSATYYTLGGRGWMFQTVMAAVGFTLLPVWLSASAVGCEWMAFLSCAGLLFCAAAPCFRLKLEGAVHYSSAVVCCVCAVLWQITEGCRDVTLCCGFLALMLSLQNREKYMWWIEAAVIASVYLNLLLLI